MIRKVVVSRAADKQLKGLPKHIATKFLAWVDDVEDRGLEEARKVPGRHDEPLKGARAGQRSIRLNDSYRAIYVIRKDEVEFVSVEEITNHKY